MSKITVSKEARKDIVSIHQYIHDELGNPDASRRVVAALKQSILLLADFANRR